MANATFKKDDKGNVGQAAENLKNKAQEAAGTVADKAKELGSSAVQTADAAAGTVGSGMKSLADTIKQNTPNEGMMGAASDALAGTVESAGRYLEEQGVSGAAEDFTNLIRRHPIPAVLVGIGVGFLLARLTSRS
jgi:hypothetical protein